MSEETKKAIEELVKATEGNDLAGVPAYHAKQYSQQNIRRTKCLSSKKSRFFAECTT